MTQTATVKKTIDSHRALVAVTRQSACSGDCHQCHGCIHPQETIEVEALNEAGAHPGDKVTVESATGRILGLAALLYVMPLVLLFAGYCLPVQGEGAKILSSIGGLLIGGVLCGLYSRRMKKRREVTFTITRVID